jgi:Transmembrane secretion effector
MLGRMVVRDSLGVLHERDFRLLLAGQALSNLGSALVPVALAFAVLDLTGSATDLGLVLLASRLPNMVLVLTGGVVADRLSRRWVMLASDVIRCLTQAATATLLVTGTARLWELLVLQAAHGAAAAFFDPAATGLLPETVGPGRLQQANALLGLSRSGTGILGQVGAGTRCWAEARPASASCCGARPSNSICQPRCCRGSAPGDGLGRCCSSRSAMRWSALSPPASGSARRSGSAPDGSS